MSSWWQTTTSRQPPKAWASWLVTGYCSKVRRYCTPTTLEGTEVRYLTLLDPRRFGVPGGGKACRKLAAHRVQSMRTTTYDTICYTTPYLRCAASRLSESPVMPVLPYALLFIHSSCSFLAPHALSVTPNQVVIRGSWRNNAFLNHRNQHSPTFFCCSTQSLANPHQQQDGPRYPSLTTASEEGWTTYPRTGHSFDPRLIDPGLGDLSYTSFLGAQNLHVEEHGLLWGAREAGGRETGAKVELHRADH